MTRDGDDFDPKVILRFASDIVAAYVSNNALAVEEIPSILRLVHGALDGLGQDQQASTTNQGPAVAITESITQDYLICLEDGKKLKMLKRYLRSRYSLSPEEYRAKWGLPADYPMVAPNYAAQRSKLAKKIGLGQSGAPRRARGQS
ncbi:MAG: transcriptional regulator [Rhodobiaceae bacterium]|nr:MAG: transcriptional regulator [Rhodobiaceae bacterium]